MTIVVDLLACRACLLVSAAAGEIVLSFLGVCSFGVKCLWYACTQVTCLPTLLFPGTHVQSHFHLLHLHFCTSPADAPPAPHPGLCKP